MDARNILVKPAFCILTALVLSIIGLIFVMVSTRILGLWFDKILIKILVVAILSFLTHFFVRLTIYKIKQKITHRELLKIWLLRLYKVFIILFFILALLLGLLMFRDMNFSLKNIIDTSIVYFLIGLHFLVGRMVIKMNCLSS